ncbi:hypothetical protein ACROYT_G030381 [Oculina patagonica]
MALSKQEIKKEMTMDYVMDVCVNGHSFTVQGTGVGNPYDGHQRLSLQVKSEQPLPFAFDILSAAFAYGNRCFTKYPEGITDMFKQAFPGGLSWERTMAFEDGGVASVSADVSIEKDGCFKHRSKFVGVNFPVNGPVMQNKTRGWEPSVEKMTVRDGTLKGHVTMFLKLEGGGNYRCDYETTYKPKKPVKPLPDSHFIEHRLVTTITGNKVELQEDAEARNFVLGK